MRACTSGTFSIVMVFPLSFEVYLLMADWDKPRISAACCSFIPCFSTMVLAMRALMAGKTALTPTSHGNSKILHQLVYSVRNVYKYDACHNYMTCVMTGISPKQIFFAQSLTPLPVRTHVNEGNNK